MTRDATDPRALLASLEQTARKRFGQHFLVDRGVVDRIVRGSRVAAGDRVVEVGPGLGVLTRALLGVGAEVTAIELDRDLAAFLRRDLPDLALIETDAAKVRWAELCEGGGWKMVSNLPYNVGTTVVMSALRARGAFTSVTVMLQREVVERICAGPGTSAYGALSVEVAVRAVPTFLLSVPPDRFHPRPKVDSAVVRLDVLPEPQVGSVTPEHFDRVVRAGFSQRRKTLLNALGAAFGRERAGQALAAADVDPGLRAERLDADGFRRLAAALSD
ncbi:MAG: ribosomal RNA small subunit methyltransferase A [Alphaproteobacteria bacterium]|nr:ribosomal RNA small subunit methyltransferase A [Alphaproteobacteria bacterium]